MSTVRALRTFSAASSTRTRLPAAPRRVRTRQHQRHHHPPEPKKDGDRFNSAPVYKFITFFSLGWWVYEIINGRWSGNAWKSPPWKSQPSPGPKILAQLIDSPRLPSYEKSQVRQDRATAEKKLLELYPSDEYEIVVDASLPGDYYHDDPNPLFTNHDNIDESSTSTQPITLYRVDRIDIRASKGKTVALLLYAHPGANLGLSALALTMQTIVQAMDDAGAFAMDLTRENLTTFTQRGEWIESLTWQSMPKS